MQTKDLYANLCSLITCRSIIECILTPTASQIYGLDELMVCIQCASFINETFGI